VTSNIDPTYPTSGSAYTADVRRQFATAASEISTLQDALGGGANTITFTWDGTAIHVWINGADVGTLTPA
jgi:hypothetical protein